MKLVLKGFIVGIGKIIPGVSGAMLAFALGIYEKVIDAVTHFFTSPKENGKLLMKFSIGVLLAIILFSRFLLFLLNHYYFITMYLFLGLIVGTLIPFTKNLKINKKNTAIFLLSLGIFLLLTMNYQLDIYIYHGSLFDYFYIIFLGMIDAFTSIIPGISGTAIFMMLGSYEFVLSILGNPFCFLFILYGIGMIVGIILVCYLMYYLLKNRKEETYSFVFAFMIGSVVLLCQNLIHSFHIGLFLIFMVGILFGYLFDK